ncbi:hypothetical protein SVIOM342S_07794 [Streptomyces violaceorubidus]
MSSSTPHRRTSHTTSPVSSRRTTHRRAAAVALAGVAALIATAVHSGTATAAPDPSPVKGNELVKLSPSQRAELIRDANATKAETADDLGLGAKEKWSSGTCSRTATAPCTPATSAPTTVCPSSAATSWWPVRRGRRSRS